MDNTFLHSPEHHESHKIPPEEEPVEQVAEEFPEDLQSEADSLIEEAAAESLNEGEVDQAMIDEATERATPYPFPESSDSESGGVDEGNAKCNWHFNNLSCHLDKVRDNVTTDEQAAEWYRLKLAAAEGRSSGWSPGKWEQVNKLQDACEALVIGLGGDTTYQDA